ncbi:uncharacterized protein B0H18DRAFT_844557, partial [Fomitopsis serialis]|uniref:uncharacterized protein n=1 Tax=Fomitopsis serialis TaxID=139415 RepID=UPI002008D53A
PLRIVSTTKYLATALVMDLAGWEDRGWIDVPDATLLRVIVSHLRQRCAVTTLAVASQKTDWERMNIAWDAQLERPRPQNITHEISLEQNHPFSLTGARLACLTQRLAYRGIRATREHPVRKTSQAIVSEALAHIGANSPDTPSSQQLWLAIRSTDIRKPASDFLWKVLQGALRCGRFWAKIPGYEDRATCHQCGSLDSIEHILFHCKATDVLSQYCLAQG